MLGRSPCHCLLLLLAGWFALPAQAKAARAQTTAKPATSPDGPRQADQVVKVGVDLSSITKFDVAAATFIADFFLSLQCAGNGDCQPKFELGNGKIISSELAVDEPQRKLFKVKAEMSGEVDLSEFPFDRHQLPIVVVEDPRAGNNVTFEIDKEHTSIDGVTLSGWQITESDAATEVQKVEGIPDGISMAGFGVEVRRPRVAAFFKNLLPILFIVLASWVALFISTKATPSRIATITGGLLACVMFHVSSTSSLPPLASLTRVDKFLIATYAGQLVNITLAVLIARYDEAKDEARAKKIYNRAFVVVPAFTVLAWVASILV